MERSGLESSCMSSRLTFVLNMIILRHLVLVKVKVPMAADATIAAY